jgi:uncharacterized protein (UPF0548 family)
MLRSPRVIAKVRNIDEWFAAKSMFLFRRPSSTQLEEFLEESHRLPLSYNRVHLADGAPAGFRADEAGGVLGRGAETFARACLALKEWRHFDLGWVSVFPRPVPITTGTDVVVVIHHLGFWSINGCRVVYEIGDREDGSSFGFAYGTLTNHAELGEEIFEVSIDPLSEDVRYRIRAVSKPRALAARIGYPITRKLQEQFRQDSIAAMCRALAS